MVTIAEEGLKGNKKGRPIWTFVKKTSLAVTVLGFIVTTVLVLDAYKFVTIRHAKFARKKLLSTLRHMDPSLIESHTGMKVLPKEEFDLLSTQLESARSEIREMNAKTQEKFKAVLQADSEVKMMKEGIEELKKLIAIKGEEAKASAEEEKKEEAAAPVVEEKKEEAAAAPAEEVAVPVEEEKKE